MDEDCSIERDEPCKPTVNDNRRCVFSEDPYFYNDLVILTNKKIPMQEPIPWIKEKITARDTEMDYLIKLANGFFPGLFYVKHSKTRLFFRKKNTPVAIKGTLPQLQNERLLRMETHGRRVDAMFDRFAMTCIENDRLCKNVDLKSFSVNAQRCLHQLL